jgi:trehalose/maltose hydrolase-like predicted phosphorylase
LIGHPDGWLWTYEGWEPEVEGLREAPCTLGNGYVATRGAAAEATADGIHYPGTYLAGVYNRVQGRGRRTGRGEREPGQRAQLAADIFPSPGGIVARR